MSKKSKRKRIIWWSVGGLFFAIPVIVISPILMNLNTNHSSSIMNNLLKINNLNSSKTANEIKTVILNKKKGDELTEKDLGVSTSEWNIEAGTFSHKLLMIDDGTNYSGNIGQLFELKVQLSEINNKNNKDIKFISIIPYVVDFKTIQENIKSQSKSTTKTNVDIKATIASWAPDQAITEQDLSTLGIKFNPLNNVTITKTKYKSAEWNPSDLTNKYENYVKVEMTVSHKGESSTFEVKLFGDDSIDLSNSQKALKTQTFLDNINDKTVEDSISNKFSVKSSEFNSINFNEELSKIFPEKFGESVKYNVISYDDDTGEVKIEAQYTYDSKHIAKKTYTMHGFNRIIPDTEKKTMAQDLLDNTNANKIQSAITDISNIFPTSFDISKPKNKGYLDNVFADIYGEDATYSVENQDDINGSLDLNVTYKFGKETAIKKYQLTGFRQKTDQEIVDGIIASINIQDDTSPLLATDIKSNIGAANSKDETNLHTVFGLPSYDISNIQKHGATITWTSNAVAQPSGAKYMVSVVAELNGVHATKNVTVESSDIDTTPNPDFDIHQVYQDIIAIMPSRAHIRSTMHHWQLPGQEVRGNTSNFISTFGLPAKYDISGVNTRGTRVEWDAIPTSTSNPTKYFDITIKISKNGGTEIATYWCRIDSID